MRRRVAAGLLAVALGAGTRLYVHSRVPALPPEQPKHTAPSSATVPRPVERKLTGLFASCGAKSPETLARIVAEESRKFALDPMLVGAVVYVESKGDVAAVSRCGAKGPMQVMWSVWGKVLPGCGVAQREADLFHPVKGIRAGCVVLRHYLQRTDDLGKALAAYSGGATNYLRKVMAAKAFAEGVAN